MYLTSNTSILQNHRSLSSWHTTDHLELGYADPTSSEPLHLLIRGIRRLQCESPHHRLPITTDTLHILKQSLRCTNLSLCEQCLLWSVFTLAFYGFLRASEFTGLQWTDISFTTQDISVTIGQSKTYPFRKGHTLHITSTGTSICPVKVLRKYVAMTPRESQYGPLFSAGQFFPLIRTQLSSISKCLLRDASYYPDLYCTHRFRIGAAKTLGKLGAKLLAMPIRLNQFNPKAYVLSLSCSFTCHGVHRHSHSISCGDCLCYKYCCGYMLALHNVVVVAFVVANVLWQSMFVLYGMCVLYEYCICCD